MKNRRKGTPLWRPRVIPFETFHVGNGTSIHVFVNDRVHWKCNETSARARVNSYVAKWFHCAKILRVALKACHYSVCGWRRACARAWYVPKKSSMIYRSILATLYSIRLTYLFHLKLPEGSWRIGLVIAAVRRASSDTLFRFRCRPSMYIGIRRWFSLSTIRTTTRTMTRTTYEFRSLRLISLD